MVGELPDDGGEGESSSLAEYCSLSEGMVRDDSERGSARSEAIVAGRQLKEMCVRAKAKTGIGPRSQGDGDINGLGKAISSHPRCRSSKPALLRLGERLSLDYTPAMFATGENRG